MIRALKSLIGMANRSDATSSEIAPTVDGAEAELKAARLALAGAEAAYRSSLLNADAAALKQLADARTDATIRIDRAEALLTALQERLAEANEREAEAQRVERYSAAQKQADEAREVLRTVYPKAAQDILRILRAVAEAEIAVRNANADLPRTAARLAGIEDTVRSIPGEPEKIHGTQEVTRWCRPGDLRHDQVAQHLVQIGTDGTGYVQPSYGQAEYLVKRTFIETTFTPQTTGDMAYDLSSRLELPGLLVTDGPIWKALDDYGGGPQPEEVLAALDRREALPACSNATPSPVQRRYQVVGVYDLAAEMQPRSTIRDRVLGRAGNA